VAEPYAWVDGDSRLQSKQTDIGDIPLYTKPLHCEPPCRHSKLCYGCSKEFTLLKGFGTEAVEPGWQGLTDEEIHDCFQNRGRGSDGLKTRKMIAAAIEAMLKEKNSI
jgi:hypothetical protein